LTVLTVRGLGQRYGRRWILRDLDLDVGAGVTVLLGPNGAGKTTLLSTVAGLRRPAAGSVRIAGVDHAASTDRRALASFIGFLPQNLGFYPRYTLRDFLTYSAWLKKVPSGEVDSSVEDALAAVDLVDQADRTMRTLSGGTVRRAGLAQSIVHKPRLLLLDEPSAGLDPHQRLGMRKLLRTVSSRCSVLASTHHVDDLNVLADRVVILWQGRVRFVGTPTELAGAGTLEDEGDNALERGYSAVLAGSMSASPA
jgi:ABC-2 type transport system ATP-binding protein